MKTAAKDFKMTELGPIPKDWEVRRLGELGDVVTGSTPPRGDAECWGGNFNWISAKDFKGKYIVEAEETITEKGKSFCRLLPSDSVLVTCIASIGLNAIAKRPCATNQQINAVICKTCENEFLYYQIEAAKKRMMEMAGQTAVPIINKGDFENLLVSFPPLPEQRKIAAALSDVDEMIAALEKLIEKKRKIKTGAMQRLLTGKTRLPGFKGAWVEKRLGDCALIKARIGWQGLTTAEYLTSGPYYLITGSDFRNGKIDWGNCYFVDEDRYSQDRYIQIKKFDVLVSKDGTIGKVAFLDDIPGPGTLNSGVFVIRSIDEGIDQPYLAWVFLSKWFDEFIDRLVAGSTIVHLYQKDIVGFSFPVPPTLAEQKAIAKVLGDMDEEIAALEAELAKTRQLKQGMMQELLTGKVRLGWSVSRGERRERGGRE